MSNESSPASRATSSACRPAQFTSSRERTDSPPASESDQFVAHLLEPGNAEARSHLRAVALRRGRKPERVRHRVGHGLAGNLERAVVAHSRLDPVPPRVRREGLHSLPVAGRPRSQQRAAAQHRHAERVEHGIAEDGRAQDQLGLELARRRVEAGVEDPGVGPAGAEPGLGLRLQQRYRDPAARQRQRHRRADDAGADDRYLGVEHDSGFGWAERCAN